MTKRKPYCASNKVDAMARLEGLEPPAFWFVAKIYIIMA